MGSSRPGTIELLQAGLALLALGHADQRDVPEPQFLEDAARARHLPLAAVDEDQVGELALPRHHFPVTPVQDFAHRAVVVARSHALDVVVAVLVLS